jgi:hypothetical protein
MAVSVKRTFIQWEDANFNWEDATGSGYTWEEVALIDELFTGDSGDWLTGLPDVSVDKKKKLVRLIMRRKGIKLYDEYKEVTNITARVEDIKMIVKEVKARIELV